ncbi:MAG: hypothetical protein R6V58_05030 [Planctomycetota bacterium]
MKKLMVCSVACAVLLVGAAASAAELELEITVRELSGVARKAEPVSGGIPLPWGVYKKGQQFALFDGGKAVPLQAVPHVVDGDGFIRWVLLDFQTDLKANETKTFALKKVDQPAAVAAAAPVVRLAKEAGNVVTIDTGKVTLTIDKTKPFSLFTSVKAGGKAVVSGGSASYTDDFDGKTYTADKPSSVEIEYNGPLRATVAVKGRFVGDDQTKLQYLARITAWKGHSHVHVKYSLSNSNPDHYCYRRVKDSHVELELAAAPAGSVIGASKPLRAGADAWMQQSSRSVNSIIHTHDNLGGCPWLRRTVKSGACKAVSGGKDVWVNDGDLSEGWLAVKLDGGSVWVTDLYFVEDPPRRLAVKDGSLVLTGVTEPLAGAKPPFAVRARWLFDCSHLSSQYVLDFAPPAEPAALSAAAMRARARPWAIAPPSWYFETNAFAVGKFGTQADELKCYDTWGWKYDRAKAPRKGAGQIARIGRWTGGDDNHFTSEQDTLDGLVLMYLRTGSRPFFDAAQSWANYFTDLQTWRTDGWRWKDGGGWWHGGPAGNRPQRTADPVTGVRNRLPAEWTKSFNAKPEKWDRATCRNISYLFLAKACHCHNWGEGLAEWFCLTGDRDAYEAAIDTVEQNYDTHHRAFRRTPGTAKGYSRDFTRSSYLTHATRLIAPTDPYVVKASDYFAACYLQRPNPEPRGLANAAGRLRRGLSEKTLRSYVGQKGIDEAERLGIVINAKTGQLTDPKTGAKWYPIAGPATWMYPPLSRAMGTYHRITGNEDARDWLIAYGQAVARVLWQPKHGNFSSRFLVDFPTKGVAKDHPSWVLPEDAKNGEGVRISGYLGGFHPDVIARAYSLCGEPLLKQRAYECWYYSSHRGYRAEKMHNVGGVGKWVNLYSTHNESVCFTGHTFYVWAHPRDDTEPPEPIKNLAVIVKGDRAKVEFTAPADRGGGKVARYQLKYSDKPLVDYGAFLDHWKKDTNDTVTNWWLGSNVDGEPKPEKPGDKVTFTVNVPEGAKHFAVRSFDDSRNRSAMSNVANAAMELGKADIAPRAKVGVLFKDGRVEAKEVLDREEMWPAVD